METFHSEEGAKQMNARVGADKPVGPSHPRVAAHKFEFLFRKPHFMISMKPEKVFLFY